MLMTYNLDERIIGMNREQLVTYFTIGVGCIWGAATIVSMVTKDYTVLTAITPIMLIVTAALVTVINRKNGNGGNK